MATNLREHCHLVTQRFKDESEHTATSVEQRNVEELCLRLFGKHDAQADMVDGLPVLNRKKTTQFLRKGLTTLSEGYECLDASRPWILYWILHSLELLDEEVDPADQHNIVQFLARCQDPNGGYGGGPGQLPHLAPTYAAVNALMIIGTEEAFALTNRPKLYSWLDKLRQPDGSFTMHVDGEVDIRGVYCALSVARITNIYTSSLFTLTDLWLADCQTYEGGFGACPGMEAHGGYSFCGLAGLMLMQKGKLCNIDNLLRWTSNKQMRLEGGFQGRTNKLVDGCYSFWQGGVFPLLHDLLPSEELEVGKCEHWLFNTEALQHYLLICCQDHRGGLKDKPGKSSDFYHTCYGLSGLSVCQNFIGDNLVSSNVVGDASNELVLTHPLYNIGLQAAKRAVDHFSSLPSIQI